MNSAPKYIAVNGRMVLNPEYQEQLTDEQKAKVLADVANPSRALTCVYGMSDANEAVNTMGLPTPSNTLQTFAKVQSTTYIQAFGANSFMDGGQLLENMSMTFSKYQIPVGLASKLTDLEGYALHFKIDDSGSMSSRSANGMTRWNNVERRLHILIDLLQHVPTGPITLSYLNRYDTIRFERRGETPEQFAQNAHQQITFAFRSSPSGGTPLYSNIKNMLKTQVKTSHYLLTDGVPNQYGGGQEDMEREIRDIKNLLIGRKKPAQNPFTFLCCSDVPTDTLWMHEIEEIACYPGRPGYVAALQNFLAERVEVLNDQGPEFPYSEAVWVLCNLCAALNPDDLDALDQHAPFTKPTLDNLMGRTLTDTEYSSYFKQHPNAMWLFKEDYEALLTTPIARMIPSIAFFDKTLSDRLSKAINAGNDISEPIEIGNTEELVLTKFKRERPNDIRNARRQFWQNHCLNMERMQSLQAKQDIWGDYVAWRNLQSSWSEYIQPVLYAPSLNGAPVNKEETYTFKYPDYYPRSNYYIYDSNNPKLQSRYRNNNNACCSIF